MKTGVPGMSVRSGVGAGRGPSGPATRRANSAGIRSERSRREGSPKKGAT